MIGAMRHKVEIQKPVDVSDALGGRSTTWTKVVKVWAAVAPSGSQESLINDQQQHVTSHTVTIRHRTDVLPKWRILFRTRELEIDSVHNNNERDRFLNLTCLEKHV